MGNVKQTIEQRVKLLISDKLLVDLEEVTDDSLIYDHLGADSLDAIEIIMELEKEFNIEISDDIVENLNTVKDHVDIVEKLCTNEILTYVNKNTEGSV